MVALALGLGVAELVAGAMGRTTTPFVAVGEAFIDLVPPWLKDLAVEWFGIADKTVLLGGMAVVFVAGSAAVGMLLATSRRVGLAVTAVLLAVVVLAVWSRPDTTTIDVVPTVVGALAAIVALNALVRRAEAVEAENVARRVSVTAAARAAAPSAAAADPVTRAGSRSGRRSFLVGAAVTGGLAVASAGLGRWFGARRTGVEASREGLADQVGFPDAAPPPGADLGVAPTDPWRTPNPDFYRIDTALSVPLVRAEDWRLRIHGMVEREVTLSYADLVDLGLVDRWVTLTCVSNEVGGGLAGNALWTGVPIADVLALAGPSPDADAIRSTSDDGWNAGTPLDVLTDGRDALLAVGMNGAPLPVEHGFPVRMVVPGLYGYVSATKWVVDLEVTRFDAFEAYWTTRGWSERGPVKVASRIDVPRRGDRIESGPVTVAGVAWAQHRGIAAVEVRLDAGPWQQAELGGVPSTDTWVQWRWDADATSGTHQVEVRATTSDGEVQTSDIAPPAPDGATGWHRVEFDVG